MVELIKGKVFRMSPAPSTAHQKVSAELHRQIDNFLHKKEYQAFAAPFDVRLPIPKEYELQKRSTRSYSRI